MLMRCRRLSAATAPFDVEIGQRWTLPSGKTFAVVRVVTEMRGGLQRPILERLAYFADNTYGVVDTMLAGEGGWAFGISARRTPGKRRW